MGGAGWQVTLQGGGVEPFPILKRTKKAGVTRCESYPQLRKEIWKNLVQSSAGRARRVDWASCRREEEEGGEQKGRVREAMKKGGSTLNR